MAYDPNDACVRPAKRTSKSTIVVGPSVFFHNGLLAKMARGGILLQVAFCKVCPCIQQTCISRYSWSVKISGEASPL